MRRRFAFIKDWLDPTNHTFVGIPMMFFFIEVLLKKVDFLGGAGKDCGEEGMENFCAKSWLTQF